MITLYGFPEQQLRLPFPDLPDPIFSRRTLGLLGELTVLRAFQRLGFDAERQRCGADIRLTSLTTGERILLEVKTARRARDGQYHFCLYRELPRGVCTDYRHADYVILLALVGDGTAAISFIIPVANLEQKQIGFRDPMTTQKFSRYRIEFTSEYIRHV